MSHNPIFNRAMQTGVLATQEELSQQRVDNEFENRLDHSDDP